MSNDIGAAFDTAVARIVERCKRLDVPLTKLCEITGTSRSTLLRWSRGRPATIKTLERYSAALDRLEAEAKK